MTRFFVFAAAAMAPLAAAQEATTPGTGKKAVAPAPPAMRTARQNLDAVAPVLVVTPPKLQPAIPGPALEFPLCGSFPGGPSLVKDGDTWKIRMRPGDTPLPAAQSAAPAEATK
jgi:hypothetical protein